MKYDYTINSSETEHTYTAKKKGDSFSLYDILTLKMDEEGYSFLKLLNTEGSLGAEIHEIFEENGYFHVVFKAGKGRHLFSDSFLISKSFEERILLARAYVVEMMDSHLPDELLYLLQEKKNIYVTEEGRVFFNTQMNYRNLSEYKNSTQAVTLCAIRVKEILFPEEVIDNLILKGFHKKINEGLFTQYGEVYREILLFEHYDKKEQIVEPFYYLEDILQNERLLSVIKKVIYGLAFAALLFTGGKLILNAKEKLLPAAEPYTGVYRIGNLYLQEERVEPYGAASSEGSLH